MLESLKEQFDRIVVFDTETTGVEHRADEIIEIGIMQASFGADRPVPEREEDLLIRLTPGKSLPPFITNLTGITNEMLRDRGVDKAEACRTLEDFFGGGRTLLVAYNAQFDLCFLYFFLRAFGKAELLRGVRMLDAMTVYKDRRPYPHKLQNAIDAYSLETQNTHRAVDDARATLELLYAMAAEQDDLDCYINLFGYNPKYGVSGPRISSVRYVPQGYHETQKLYEKLPDPSGCIR